METLIMLTTKPGISIAIISRLKEKNIDFAI